MYNLDHNSNYMEYAFDSLNVIRRLTREEAKEQFLHFYNSKKEKYKCEKILDYNDLFDCLADGSYFLMNNEPRRKGKKIFFTGNAVISNKSDLLNYIKIPINEHELIVPLMIVPVNDEFSVYNLPEYIITTQEVPVFEYWTLRDCDQMIL